MIIIIGLVILIAAVVAGVAGVLSNSGSGHPLTHHFAVFGYHVTGSDGTLFLYGIVVGALAVFGLSLLLSGARRTSRRGRAGEVRAGPVPPRDRRRQQGPRRPARPARDRPRLHRQHAGERPSRRRRRSRGRCRRRPAQPAAPVRASIHLAASCRPARTTGQRTCPRCPRRRVRDSRLANGGSS